MRLRQNFRLIFTLFAMCVSGAASAQNAAMLNDRFGGDTAKQTAAEKKLAKNARD